MVVGGSLSGAPRRLDWHEYKTYHYAVVFPYVVKPAVQKMAKQTSLRLVRQQPTTLEVNNASARNQPLG